MRYQAPRGTEDVLPSQSHRWLRLEGTFREMCRLYGYREIRTPTFEDTELFVRSAGETSDVVSKQMYTFVDKGGRSVTLKPEGTAPAMRALIEAGLLEQGNIQRVSYITPVFRYERPQKGRLREPHQVGIELVGSASPEADAEVIEFTVRFFESLGMKGVSVLLNSLGRSACRAEYRKALLEFAAPILRDFPLDFRERVQKNPLRLLDSKDPKLEEAMRHAPKVLDFLEPESRERFDKLRRLLEETRIAFAVEPGIVRGLDYYTDTVFEVQSGSLGSQNALCGGGRYDGLVKELGGPDVPAVGVAMGIERALIVLEAMGVQWPADGIDVFVAALGEETRPAARCLVRELREGGFSALYDLEGRSLKSQLGQADKAGARWTAILGPDEIVADRVTLRDMRTGEQASTPRKDFLQTLARMRK